MRMCWEVVLLKPTMIMLLIVQGINSSTALGQSSTAQFNSSPPTLGLNTFISSCTQVMRSEIMDLADKEALAHDTKQTILQAQINIRRFAIELLIQGEKEESQGVLAVFTGLRLFHGRKVLDDALKDFASIGNALQAGADDSFLAQFSAAYDELQRFNKQLLNVPNEIPIIDRNQLDMFLARSMLPLKPAIELIMIETSKQHWPSQSAINSINEEEKTNFDNSDSHTSTGQLLNQLRLQFAETPLRDDTHDKINTILDWLDRGATFPEFQQQIKRYSELFLEVFEFALELEKADWLDESARIILKDRLHGATVLFEDRTSRALGLQQFNQLLKINNSLAHTTNLAAKRIDVKPINLVLIELIKNTDPNKSIDSAVARKLQLIIDRMITFRKLDTPKLHRDFRLIMRKLNGDYLESEKHLLANLQEIASDANALVDPSISTLISDQKQYLEDLQRTAQLPDWISLLSQLIPKSANNIQKQLLKISKLLIETNSRPGAIATLDKLGEQLLLFNPLPFESQLYSGNPAVIKITGARHRELAASINESRMAWIQAWVDDVDTQETANHMMMLYRFTQLLGDAAGLVLSEDKPFTLNRWAGWELPAEIIMQRSADLPTRLKLATAAAIDGDDQTLKRQLDRIDREAPFAKLVGRLHQTLSQALVQLPDGALSVLGQTISVPSDDSWGNLLRNDIAYLCIYTLEYQHAVASGQTQIAKSLEIYVNRLASELIDELNTKY